MNAVIAEIHGVHAAALLEDGRFIRIHNAGYAVGQRITLSRRKQRSRPWIAIAAAFLMTIGLAGLANYALYTPYAYVSVDVNPSVALTLNRLYRVISIDAVNDDGASIVEALAMASLQNAPAEEAVAATVSALLGSEYVAADATNYMIIAAHASSDASSQSLAESLSQAARNVDGAAGKLAVAAVGISGDLLAQAHTEGISPGKLEVVRQLAQAASGYDPDAWLEKPVAEIAQEAQTQANIEGTTQLLWVPAGETEPETSPTPSPSATPKGIYLPLTESATKTPSATAEPTASPTPSATAKASATATAATDTKTSAPPAIPEQSTMPAQPGERPATLAQPEAGGQPPPSMDGMQAPENVPAGEPPDIPR